MAANIAQASATVIVPASSSVRYNSKTALLYIGPTLCDSLHSAVDGLHFSTLGLGVAHTLDYR
jgi:hypothetical protein